MGKSRKRTAGAQALKLVAVMLTLTALALALASCGGDSKSTESTSGTKLPPGTSAESVSQTSTTTTGTTTSNNTASSNGATSTKKTTTSSAGSHQEGVTLEDVNFTVTGVTRADSNSEVVSGNNRELDGDFLQVDLAVTNASGGLAELSDYSFRLYSTAIDASSYDDYYGNTTTYGGYVKANTISAALLDSSTLQQVSYVLRDGESVDEAFLFYDLNPLSIDANADFTMDGAVLIIYDTETAESVEISLAGFAGQ